jgi:hypothetical protein
MNDHQEYHRLPIDQPPGEDFFLANIQIDNPDDPCWDDGFSVIGDWKVISRTLSRYLAFDERARRSKVFIYQSEAAKRRFLAGLREELRYQQQKRAQPNN